MIPGKVKVGGFYYSIIVTDDPLILKTRQCKGIIDYEHQVIQLAGDSVQSEQGRMQTLFHELIHALRHSRGLDWGDNDELYTDEIGIALHALFVDNGIEFAQADYKEVKEIKPKAAKVARD